MTDFTIITTTNEIQVAADRFAFDDGDLYLYRDGEDGDDDGAVAQVPEDRFVAVFETDHGTTDPLPP